ncbi:extensin, partial [Rhizobium ruizarguesonis]
MPSAFESKPDIQKPETQKPEISEPNEPAAPKTEPAKPMQGPPLPPGKENPQAQTEENKPPAAQTLEEQHLTIEPESD